MSQAYLNIPRSLLEARQTELVSDLGGVHGVGKVLLVSEDEKEGVSEFILVQHPLEFLTSLYYTITIVGVHDENNTLGVLEVFKKEETIVSCRSHELSRSGQDAQCLQRGRILSCPPTSQTVNEMFLYSTVSTLKPNEIAQIRVSCIRMSL